MNKIDMPRAAIALAVLDAAIDDLRHTDNMTDRTNYYLGLSETEDYVDYLDMIAACEWARSIIEANNE